MSTVTARRFGPSKDAGATVGKRQDAPPAQARTCRWYQVRCVGKLVRSFGGGIFIFPHGLHVDRDGNVWVTDARAATPAELEKFPDAAGKGHQVVKFSPEGKVLLLSARLASPAIHPPI